MIPTASDSAANSAMDSVSGRRIGSIDACSRAASAVAREGGPMAGGIDVGGEVGVFARDPGLAVPEGTHEPDQRRLKALQGPRDRERGDERWGGRRVVRGEKSPRRKPT